MSDDEPQVLFSKDICRLFDCGVNEIPRLISEGTIPKPLPCKQRGRRRWAKAAVNRKLGINDSVTVELEVRRLVSEELARLLQAGARD